MASSARRSSSAASGASSPPSTVTSPIERVGWMSKPATRSGCSMAARSTSTAGDAPLARQHGELVLADPGQQRRFREGGGQPRAQRRQHEVGALVAERLVEAPQAIEVGDHQLVGARLACSFSRARATKLRRSSRPVRRIALGGGEAHLAGDDAGGAQALLQPDAAPEAGLGAAHPQPRGDLGAGLADPQHVLGGGAVLRQHQRAQGGGGGFGRQRAKAQGARCAGEPQAVALGLPHPQRRIRRAESLEHGRRVPDQPVGRRQSPSSDPSGALRRPREDPGLDQHVLASVLAGGGRRDESEQEMIFPDTVNSQISPRQPLLGEAGFEQYAAAGLVGGQAGGLQPVQAEALERESRHRLAPPPPCSPAG